MVAEALFALQSDSEPARAARVSSWTVPLDYGVAEDMMRESHVGAIAGASVRTKRPDRFAIWLGIGPVLALPALTPYMDWDHASRWDADDYLPQPSRRRLDAPASLSHTPATFFCRGSAMAEASSHNVRVFLGEDLAAYNFGSRHPFGPQRHHAFERRLENLGLRPRVAVRAPVQATPLQLAYFHTLAHINEIRERSDTGTGFLDQGDTPAFVGMYPAAATVVGSTLDGLQQIWQGEAGARAFVPIAGLHHARRDGAAGFCIFNDCGVAIELALRDLGLERVAYVDIDAHHGDGVYYGFEDDPRVIIVDVHEDGQYLYPGTGARRETGQGRAKGTKMNVPLPPGATDRDFFRVWDDIEAFLREHRPQLFLLQCGADSLAGDPLTHLQYSAAVHRHVAQRLCVLADDGRLLAMGGGGYDLDNLAEAWCAVVEAMLEA